MARAVEQAIQLEAQTQKPSEPLQHSHSHFADPTVNKEIIALLLADSGKQFTQLSLAILIIVAGLKRQPGFDVSSFEAGMMDAASKYPEPEHRVLRLLLEVAGGKPPKELRI